VAQPGVRPRLLAEPRFVNHCVDSQLAEVVLPKQTGVGRFSGGHAGSKPGSWVGIDERSPRHADSEYRVRYRASIAAGVGRSMKLLLGEFKWKPLALVRTSFS